MITNIETFSAPVEARISRDGNYAPEDGLFVLTLNVSMNEGLAICALTVADLEHIASAIDCWRKREGAVVEHVYHH